MEAAILLILAAAGQTGWTPDRYNSPPPAASTPANSAPNYDRYTMPPASSRSNVAPPPGVADQSMPINQNGATMRDGLESGMDAANDQLSRNGSGSFDQSPNASQGFQSWTNESQQFQSTDENYRTATNPSSSAPSRRSASNPFAPSSAQPPAAAAKTRNGVAPPPWAQESTTAEPDWANESTQDDDLVDRRRIVEPTPSRTASGWTSIGTDIPAPRLLIPRLGTPPASDDSPLRLASNRRQPGVPPMESEREPLHQSFADRQQPAAPAAARADDWSTGWGTGAQPATIGPSDADQSAGNFPRESDLASQQRMAQRPQESAQANPPAAQGQQNSWANLWAEDDPFPQSNQASQARPNSPPANQPGSTSRANNPAIPNGTPPSGASQASAPGPAPAVVLPATNQQTGPGPATQTAGAVQPPWMPLLVVSLSLAGSIGANLFLGFSYLDARQKYQSLVRKTAATFRRSAAAA